jgi:hypothetical protein
MFGTSFGPIFHPFIPYLSQAHIPREVTFSSTCEKCIDAIEAKKEFFATDFELPFGILLCRA